MGPALVLHRKIGIPQASLWSSTGPAGELSRNGRIWNAGHSAAGGCGRAAGYLAVAAIVTSLSEPVVGGAAARASASIVLGGGRASQAALAANDVRRGLALWRLWSKLGWNDILQRYRRSVLGPLWLTMSMATTVVALGIVYAHIFKMPLQDFMPFLCVGMLVWGLLSSFLSEAGTLFVGAESFIKQVRLPYSVYVFRFIWSRVIIFAHNFLIYFGILVYFQLWPGAGVLYAIPALAVLILNGLCASTTLGILSARFRDIPQIIVSLVQILFLVTPIMWKPELLSGREALLTFNPVFHLLELIRAPLLGQLPTTTNVGAAAIITTINFAVACSLFVRFRSRLAYWV